MTNAKRLLVVLKQSAYELYKRRFDAGEVFTNVRWDRLRDRHSSHSTTVNTLLSYLSKRGVQYQTVKRDDMKPLTLKESEEIDLVVSVGGDGTCLVTSQNLKYGTPLVAVNSDPTPPEIRKHVYHSSQFDQARSTGHLCACGPDKLTKVIGEILDGVRYPTNLARIRTLLNGEELVPALNDILIAHPSPAAVSRYSYVWGRARKATEQERWSAEGSYQEYQHVRSSGIRLCTATGSTAANKSAGGQVMQLEDRRLQYMDREPISVDGTQCPISHAFLQPNEELELRWNSRVGYIYIDGAHTMREITIGDKLQFSTGGQPLNLYCNQSARRGQEGGDKA